MIDSNLKGSYMVDLVTSHKSYRELIWNLFSVPHRINFQWYQRPIKKFITSLKIKTWKMQWGFFDIKNQRNNGKCRF